MEELNLLSEGQKAVVDAYLANYEPADTYDHEAHILVDTQTMILHMGTMCRFGENMLCDYLAQKGFRAHYEDKDAICGWIMKEV